MKVLIITLQTQALFGQSIKGPIITGIAGAALILSRPGTIEAILTARFALKTKTVIKERLVARALPRVESPIRIRRARRARKNVRARLARVEAF